MAVKCASSLLLAVLLVIVGYSEAYHLAQQPQTTYNHDYHGSTGHLSNVGTYHHEGISAPQYQQPQQSYHVPKIVHPLIDHGHIVQQTRPAVHYPTHTVTGHFGASIGHQHQDEYDYNQYNHGSQGYDFHDHHSHGAGHAPAHSHQSLHFHH